MSAQVDNKSNSDAAEKELWEKLRAADREGLLRRTLARPTERPDVLKLSILQAEYFLDLSAETLTPCDGAHETINPRGAKRDFRWLTLLYMTGAQELPLSGKEDTPHTVPGGAQFFTGPHKPFVDPLILKFGQTPEKLLDAARTLGAEIIPKLGDAAVKLYAYPRIPVTFILRAGDDEFPADFNVVLDSTVAKHCQLDTIWAIIRESALRLSEILK